MAQPKSVVADQGLLEQAIINAPPEAVWRHVVAFRAIPEPTRPPLGRTKLEGSIWYEIDMAPDG